MRVYLANPLGFASGMDAYRASIKARLSGLGHVVFDPWDQDFSDLIAKALDDHSPSRQDSIDNMAKHIGYCNHMAIDTCNAVLAVLDGPELDSGTVSELAYAAAIGKKVFGLRTDFRDCGDFPGVPFNLQVLYFIEEVGGGKVFRSIDDIDF